MAEPVFTPVNLITGFLGSGKTTLLQRLLGHPALADTAVLINEFGEVGLDHHLLERIDDTMVLLQSGCLCCTIRGELSAAIKDLHSKRERGQVPRFRRLVVESTGLADPFPILSTVQADPVLRHHFRLGNVITTVDAVNGTTQLARQPECTKQVAVADRLVLTKTDLAEAEATDALIARLRRLNPSAPLWRAAEAPLDAEALLSHDLFATAGRSEAARRWFAAEVAPRDDEAGARPQPPRRDHPCLRARLRRAARLDAVRPVADDAAQPPRREGAAREGHPERRGLGRAGRRAWRAASRPSAGAHGGVARRRPALAAGLHRRRSRSPPDRTLAAAFLRQDAGNGERVCQIKRPWRRSGYARRRLSAAHSVFNSSR